ncbi:MAG: PEP-CTERM sorting domain-containing protein [Fibrobacteres bacterium]|nr:PEP-CTERM sorting domain-containing protein [Fibrobacterota bacterium]
MTQPGDDGSDARIAATADLDRNANPIPAVPEPGSLAMLGAGALGLLAARGLLKDQ